MTEVNCYELSMNCLEEEVKAQVTEHRELLQRLLEVQQQLQQLTYENQLLHSENYSILKEYRSIQENNHRKDMLIQELKVQSELKSAKHSEMTTHINLLQEQMQSVNSQNKSMHESEESLEHSRSKMYAKMAINLKEYENKVLELEGSTSTLRKLNIRLLEDNINLGSEINKLKVKFAGLQHSNKPHWDRQNRHRNTLEVGQMRKSTIHLTQPTQQDQFTGYGQRFSILINKAQHTAEKQTPIIRQKNKTEKKEETRKRSGTANSKVIFQQE